MVAVINISVRALVEYVHRNGSIESGFKHSNSLVEGTKAHQRLQKLYKEGDEKEVFLETDYCFKELTFHIDGRCDGIIHEEEMITIDEIKSIRKQLDLVTAETYPVHWAQAIVYAYMYAKKNEKSCMNVQLTYYQVDTEEKKSFRKMFQFEELERLIQKYIENYYAYAIIKYKHRLKRSLSAKSLKFPYEKYRVGQRKLAGGVNKAILDEQNLFVNAPTGIGKTISTIFPSVKAMGEGLVERIFYTTAKTITREVAEVAFKLLQDHDLTMKSVTLTAKDKICFKEETICQKEHCEFADGYYDRLNDAVKDLLENECLITRETIETYSKKHKICPFEFSLDIALDADAVICDYNYIFDPKVSLKRFLDEQRKKSVLLIDEAHNLVDRARDMYSARIEKSGFLQLKREYKGENQTLYQSVKEINDALISIRKQCGNQQEIVFNELQEEIVSKLEDFVGIAEKELLQNNMIRLKGNKDQASYDRGKLLMDTYFSAESFIRIAKLYDERIVQYAKIEKNEVVLTLYCVDPSHLLEQMGKGFRSKIYFSATLTPIPFYKQVLGTEQNSYSMVIPSPFKVEQTNVKVNPISTKFYDRQNSIKPIVKTIYNHYVEGEGNTLIFFPSYKYMNDVYVEFQQLNLDVDSFVQQPNMTEGEREIFLKSFRHNVKKRLFGFAVLGGIFSEGIDLKGDRLNGVVIVGVGMPQLCLERNLIRNYFTSKGYNGYDFAYHYPGMNKVLQAGGRLIRSEEDHGTIILIDERYLHATYHSLLPSEWRDYSVVDHFS